MHGSALDYRNSGDVALMNSLEIGDGYSECFKHNVSCLPTQEDTHTATYAPDV